MRNSLGNLLWLPILLLLLTGFAAAQPRPPERLLEIRRGYLAYWAELKQERQLSGLERFALLVQRVVDTEALELTGRSEVVVEQAILDDLVDVMVSDGYQAEKELVMTSSSVIGRGFIHESHRDLRSFAPRFRAGEGRFRHFAMNAAAAYVLPDFLVDIFARAVGRDNDPEADASGDSAADLATNLVGRAFARFLQRTPLAELAGGDRVSRWITERFGGP